MQMLYPWATLISLYDETIVFLSTVVFAEP